MTNVRFFTTVSAVFFLSIGTVSAAEPLAEPSLKIISSTIDAVRDAGGPCKAGTLTPLKDARDKLEGAKGRYLPSAIKKARRYVEDALDDGGDSCPVDVQAKLKEAISTLKGALDAKAAQAAPGELRKKEMRACWDYRNDWKAVDPGCHSPKKGNYPQSKSDFNRILAKLKTTSDRFEKERIVNSELRSRRKYFSVRQIDLILGTISSEVDRLGIVKIVAKRLCDSSNGHKLSRHFRDSRMRKDALDALRFGM